jgi:hypothetical protein
MEGPPSCLLLCRCGVYDLGPGGGPTAVTSIQSEEHRRRLLADRLALGDDLQGVGGWVGAEHMPTSA